MTGRRTQFEWCSVVVAAACIAAFTWSLTLVGCGFGSDGASILEKVARDTGLTIPPGSRVVRFEEPFRVVDPVWAAKILVPDSGVAALRASVDAQVAEGGRFSKGFADSLIWWRPVDVLVSKRYLTKLNIHVWVVLAKESGGVYAYAEFAL